MHIFQYFRCLSPTHARLTLTMVLLMVVGMPGVASEIPGPQRTKVAEGEYHLLTDQGIGPSIPAVYDFRESWELWRLPDGRFEVSGTRSFRSPSYEFHFYRFVAHLSAHHHFLDVTEFRKLKFRRDSGPLHCETSTEKFVCTSNAKDPSQNIKLELALKEPFALLWPPSPFSMADIGDAGGRDAKNGIAVDLVTVEEGNEKSPVRASIRSGTLRYLQSEPITVAGKQWVANKFELKIAAHAPFLIWTSTQGLLLAFAPENKSQTLTDDSLQLVNFHDSNDK